jgi:hypothetical protein
MGGRYFVPQEGALTVDARLTDTVRDSLVGEVTTRKAPGEFYAVTGDIVIQTAAALGIDLPPDEQRRLRSLPPATRNLAAFLAFGRGVELEDSGLYDRAAAEYGEAVRLDPGFRMARDRAEVLQVGTEAFRQSIERTLRAALRGLGDAGQAAMSRALGGVGTQSAENEVTDATGDAERTPQSDGPPRALTHVTGQVPVGP